MATHNRQNARAILRHRWRNLAVTQERAAAFPARMDGAVAGRRAGEWAGSRNTGGMPDFDISTNRPAMHLASGLPPVRNPRAVAGGALCFGGNADLMTARG